MDKILVVDDEPSVRRLLRAALSKSGYGVVEASDGDEGLRKALEEKPNLIISDVLMPVQDGYQMARNLRDNPVTASVPIIMLTGLNEEKDELKAFQEGVDDYIVKPVRAPVLRARVAALLSRAHAFRGEIVTNQLASIEIKAQLSKVTSSYEQLDKALGGGFPQGANVLVVGETGSGKSSLCRRILAAGLRNSQHCMMISLDDEPAMIRNSLDATLPKPMSDYEKEDEFRLVDGYSWSRGSSKNSERFAVSGVLELNQLAGIISDAGRELRQSIETKAGGLRVFDSITSLFINFELASVQRFVAQLARTATSYGGVATLFVLEEGATTEQTLNNIKYVMDGLLETKIDGEYFYIRVANMKWSKFSRDWIKLEE